MNALALLLAASPWYITSSLNAPLASGSLMPNVVQIAATTVAAPTLLSVSRDVHKAVLRWSYPNESVVEWHVYCRDTNQFTRVEVVDRKHARGQHDAKKLVTGDGTLTFEWEWKKPPGGPLTFFVQARLPQGVSLPSNQELILPPP